MTEQLTIARLGHRGDGVADTPVGTGLRALYAARRGGDGRGRRRPSRPAASSIMSTHRATSAWRRFASISASAAAARCSTGRSPSTGCGSARWSSRCSSMPASIAPVAPLIDAHGKGRRRAVLHARRGTHDVLEVGFAAPRAHHIVAIDACPVLAPELGGALKAAWAIAEVLKLDREAARHPCHRDRQRPRRRRARLRPAQARSASRALAAHRRSARPRAPDASRRTGDAARATAARPSAARRCRCRPARSCRRPPKAKRRWRRLVDRTCRQGQARRRSVRRHRHLCAAACRDGARHRRRQRGGRDQGAAARRGDDQRPEADRSAAARPVSPAVGGLGTESVRRRGVRSAAPGRRGAGARTGEERA